MRASHHRQAQKIAVDSGFSNTHVNGITSERKPTNLSVLYWTANSLQYLLLLQVDSKTSANAETKASYQWRDNVTCVIYYMFVERRGVQQNAQTLPAESAVVLLKYR
jgi:hypothetical protein